MKYARFLRPKAQLTIDTRTGLANIFHAYLEGVHAVWYKESLQELARDVYEVWETDAPLAEQSYIIGKAFDIMDEVRVGFCPLAVMDAAPAPPAHYREAFCSGDGAVAMVQIHRFVNSNIYPARTSRYPS